MDEVLGTLEALVNMSHYDDARFLKRNMHTFYRGLRAAQEYYAQPEVPADIGHNLDFLCAFLFSYLGLEEMMYGIFGNDCHFMDEFANRTPSSIKEMLAACEPLAVLWESEKLQRISLQPSDMNLLNDYVESSYKAMGDSWITVHSVLHQLVDMLGAEPVIQSFEFTFRNGNIFEGTA